MPKHVSKHGKNYSVRFHVKGKTRRFGSYPSVHEAARHIDEAKEILKKEQQS
jgi:hypothetical protein